MVSGPLSAVAFAYSASIKDHVVQAIAEILQNGDEASGLEAHRAQLTNRCPAEQMTGLNAAIQIVAGQCVWPGQVVVQANFVLKRRIAVDVLHDQCQFPGRELVPQFLRQLTCQSRPAGLTKADPATRQEPVPEPINGA